MKTLLDSNIIIFLGTDKAAQIENILVDKELNVSVITKVETPPLAIVLLLPPLGVDCIYVLYKK